MMKRDRDMSREYRLSGFLRCFFLEILMDMGDEMTRIMIELRREATLLDNVLNSSKRCVRFFKRKQSNLLEMFVSHY